MAWISVDFPTPEFPETRVVRPASSSRTSSTPRPSRTDTSSTR